MLRLKVVWNAIILVGWVALAVRGFMWWTKPPTPEQAYEQAHGPRDPAKVVGRHFKAYKSDAAAGDAELVVDGMFGLGLSNGGGITLAAVDVIELGKWMRRDPARLPKRDVVLVVEHRLVDRYGVPSTVPVLILRWPLAEWQRIRWDTVAPAQVIDLAAPVLTHPAIRKDVAAWCMVGDRRARMCRAV